MNITREKMFLLALEVCPSFRSSWEEFLAEWADDPEPLPLYLALGSLARYAIDLLSVGEHAELTKLFEVVERWHLEGEHYVKEAATIGFLEGIQNTVSHGDIDPERFRPFLLPETERWWDKLNDFWKQGKLLNED